MHKYIYFHACTGRVSSPTPNTASQQQTCTFLNYQARSLHAVNAGRRTPWALPLEAGRWKASPGVAGHWVMPHVCEVGVLHALLFGARFNSQNHQSLYPSESQQTTDWKVYVSLIFSINCSNLYLFFSCSLFPCWQFLLSVSLKAGTYAWDLCVPEAAW